MATVTDLMEENKIDTASIKNIIYALGYYEYRNRSIIPDTIANCVKAICSNKTLFEIIQILAYEGVLGKMNNITKKVRSVRYFSMGMGLNNYYNEAQRRYDLFDTPSSPFNNSECDFWIKELILLTPEMKANSLGLGAFNNPEGQPLYSLLIGTNGAGKSSLMKEIIEFFIDLHNYSNNTDYIDSSIYNGYLKGVSYHIDGVECEIIKFEKTFIAKINGKICDLKELRIPSIVACHFGAFDKLPITKVNGKSQSRYDVPYYKYVGAHVNGSLISSSAIAFRLLFALNEQMNYRQRQNICTILDLIGYDHKISLTYSFARRLRDARDIIEQRVERDREYKGYDQQGKIKMVEHLYSFYMRKTISERQEFDYDIDFDSNSTLESNYNSKELHIIYKLKQFDLIDSASVLFYKSGVAIATEDMSSGEFAMLSTILSISAAAANERHTLVLLDEPELSLHPNWQMTIIDYLDKALARQSCHLLIATHSHMLVSDLPNHRSQVIQLDKSRQGDLVATTIPECTYGWSTEEVLLKVFKTATDRNRYFGERIGNLLEKMGDNAITPENVKDELKDLQEISKHLSDVDPMKVILNTIVKTYA